VIRAIVGGADGKSASKGSHATPPMSALIWCHRSRLGIIGMLQNAGDPLDDLESRL
jgi:hypothetical protein